MELFVILLVSTSGFLPLQPNLAIRNHDNRRLNAILATHVLFVWTMKDYFDVPISCIWKIDKKKKDEKNMEGISGKIWGKWMFLYEIFFF